MFAHEISLLYGSIQQYYFQRHLLGGTFLRRNKQFIKTYTARVETENCFYVEFSFFTSVRGWQFQSMNIHTNVRLRFMHDSFFLYLSLIRPRLSPCQRDSKRMCSCGLYSGLPLSLCLMRGF